MISIHALREEGDSSASSSSTSVLIFLSTPSARRATNASCRRSADKSNFYPRPPRGGRPSGNFTPAELLTISIHALREEGDKQTFPLTTTTVQFLSTPSARRATGARREVWRQYIFLSTPSARRATSAASTTRRALQISIHALREEGDRSGIASASGRFRFLSTPSARRATTPCSENMQHT